MNQDQAEAIAVHALHHMTSQPTLLTRFMEATGLTAGALHEAAQQPDFWRAILEFLRQDEAECLAFASNAGLAANDIERAVLVLQNTRLDDR